MLGSAKQEGKGGVPRGQWMIFTGEAQMKTTPSRRRAPSAAAAGRDRDVRSDRETGSLGKSRGGSTLPRQLARPGVAHGGLIFYFFLFLLSGG